MKEHWFWWTLMLAVILWYSTVTVYVAVRGTLDIRGMLRRLAERHHDRPRDDNGLK
jgi:hypothetical protein